MVARPVPAVQLLGPGNYWSGVVPLTPISNLPPGSAALVPSGPVQPRTGGLRTLPPPASPPHRAWEHREGIPLLGGWSPRTGLLLALTHGLEQDDGRRRRNIDTTDLAGHWNGGHEIAPLTHQPPQAVAFSP